MRQQPGARLTEAVVSKRIADEFAYAVKLGVGRGFQAPGSGGGSVVEVTEGRHEKVSKMLDALFDPRDTSVSLREAYVEMTGDRRFTGQINRCDRARLTEAIGTESLPDVLGDAIHRRLVQEYAETGIYDVYQDMVTIVPVSDFRNQERTRIGGYGDLPAVAEAGAYLPLNSPGDEKAVYAVTKRGGTETLTLETITNDDVGVVKQIPIKLARAAKRTLSEFVLDIPRTNPAIYDGKALFHADHGNLGSAALSSAAVSAGRIAIKRQPEKDSGKRLGIPARFLWVPDELEETAFNLFRRNTNLDADFAQSLQIQVRPVWCWADANDWCLSASTLDIPVIELGFLTGNQLPELFVQDSPTSGSLFTNDQVTWKIRHIYGATVIDYRGIYQSVVA